MNKSIMRYFLYILLLVSLVSSATVISNEESKQLNSDRKERSGQIRKKTKNEKIYKSVSVRHEEIKNIYKEMKAREERLIKLINLSSCPLINQFISQTSPQLVEKINEFKAQFSVDKISGKGKVCNHPINLDIYERCKLVLKQISSTKFMLEKLQNTQSKLGCSEQP